MVRLVKINIDKVVGLPNIIQFIQEYYGFDKNVDVYLTNDGNNNGMITRVGDECVYLVGDDKFTTYKFYLNSNNDLVTILKDGYQIDFDEFGPIFKKDNISSNMFFAYDEECDLEGYDGRVIFNQYDESKDLNCELQFPHMYRGSVDGKNPPVYDMHLRSFRTCYLDSSYMRKGEVESGFIRRGCEYFNKFVVEKGDLDYSIICFKEGLVLDEQPRELIRYCKTKYISLSGDYITGFPFCKIFTEQDVRRYVEKLGFGVEIPELILNIYNGNDNVVNDIIDLVSQIKKVEEEKDDCMRMTLELHKD